MPTMYTPQCLELRTNIRPQTNANLHLGLAQLLHTRTESSLSHTNRKHTERIEGRCSCCRCEKYSHECDPSLYRSNQQQADLTRTLLNRRRIMRVQRCGTASDSGWSRNLPTRKCFEQGYNIDRNLESHTRSPDRKRRARNRIWLGTRWHPKTFRFAPSLPPFQSTKKCLGRKQKRNETFLSLIHI